MSKRLTNPKTVGILFMLLQSAFYASVFVVDGMFAQYLAEFGYGDSFVGLALMAAAAASLISQPLFGYWCDKRLNFRAALLLAFGVMAVSLPIFFSIGPKSKLVIMLFSLVAMSMFKAMYASVDSWISKLQREMPSLDYGRVRSVGSLAYALASIALARVMALGGYSVASWLYWVLFAVMVAAILLLPNPHPESSGKTTVTLKEAAARLFSDRRFAVFMMCSLLVWLTGSATMLFGSRYIASIGGKVTEIGIAFFVMAMAEFVVILFYSRLTRRFGSQQLLIVGMFGTAVKNVILWLCPSPEWAIVAMLSQGFSYAILIPGAVYYINELIPKEYIASALLIYNAVGLSLPQIIGSPVYGLLSEKFSVADMVGITALPAVIGGIWFAAHCARQRKKGEKTDEN